MQYIPCEKIASSAKHVLIAQLVAGFIKNIAFQTLLYLVVAKVIKILVENLVFLIVAVDYLRGIDEPRVNKEKFELQKLPHWVDDVEAKLTA